MHESVEEWSESAAADFLMLTPKDLPGLARFLRRLEKQADVCSRAQGSGIMSALADVLTCAAGRLKSLILEEDSDPVGAWTAVGDALEAAQAVARGDPIPGAEPSGQGSAASKEARAEPGLDFSPGPAEGWVDSSILAAYVEQQASVLPEMEQRALEYEKGKAPSVLSDLRRMIHTLKGESGVVGALHIENVCHRLEDYLDAEPETVSGDTLLAALDWIGNATQSFGAGRKDDDSSDILSRLAPEPESADSGAPEVTRDPATTPDAVIPIGDLELAGDFVAEAQEHFDSADENLLVLEKEPDHSESIDAVFRAFHTIKGVAGFLGMPPLGDLAHAAETLLDDIRKGRRHFSGPAVDATFGALDHLKLMVADLRSALETGGDFRVRAEHKKCVNQIYYVLGEEMLGSEDAPGSTVSTVAGAEASAEASDGASMEAPAEPESVTDEPQNAEPSRTSERPVHTSAQTMKVEAARIDALLDTIGELVIAEAIVSGDPEIRGLKSLRVEKNLAMLGKITRSLQDMGMSMRMVPIDPVFRKMARLVRDLSRKSGKNVVLDVEGGETEIDKSLVDKLGDPLVHMIRNSMDHGIEGAEERAAAHKSPGGRIVLRAFHKGGTIHIQIEDDGRGLNREAIVAKAMERGLIPSGDGIPDTDVFSLIFEPGFSTARQVTEISGRGVGMDVVKRNLDALRGSVQVQSEPGRGSVFTLVLPLTTAIIDGLLARVGREIFILPTLSVLESFRPAPRQVQSVTGRGEMVTFRGTLLPLFRLARVLEVPDAVGNPGEAIILVVEEQGKSWAFMADELLGQQQVVIKSLGEGIGSISGIAGASILADGRPGLILDAAGLIRLAVG